MKIRKIICFIDIDALFYRPEQYKQSKQLYHSFSSFLIIVFFLHSATLAQSFRYNPLKLSIRGTEFIRRPFLDSFHGFRVHSEHKAFYRFFLCHLLH